MKIRDVIFPTILILIAILVAYMFVNISMSRELTDLENILFQIFSLTSGLIGSYLLGKASAKDSAKSLIKPHARSAFRRLMSLYESLSRVGQEIQLYLKDKENRNGEIVIARLEAIVLEQLSTADDALEDWRDIVPEDVEELNRKLKKKVTTQV
jgi:hypothetical protein